MAVLALAAFALLLAMRPAAADEWRGNNAARVNATIRPCFGMLLDAQLRACGPMRHYREDGYRYYTVKTSPRPGQWLVKINTFDGRAIGRVRFSVEEQAVPPATTTRTLR